MLQVIFDEVSGTDLEELRETLRKEMGAQTVTIQNHRVRGRVFIYIDSQCENGVMRVLQEANLSPVAGPTSI